MCKAIKRPEIISKLVDLKSKLDAAKKEFDECQQKLIANMNSSGITSDETDMVKVTMTSRSSVDTAACKKIPEWVDIKAKEKVLVDQRKLIEKDHMKAGSSFIRMTFKAPSK